MGANMLKQEASKIGSVLICSRYEGGRILVEVEEAVAEPHCVGNH
jgi:hypothetical protein